MPRQARIDAPGALHHVMIRGIEKTAVFRDATCSSVLSGGAKTGIEFGNYPSAVSKAIVRGKKELEPDDMELVESQ